MQMNQEYEAEINLKDLFFHILYRWRSILLAAIVCAVALGAFQHFSISSVHAQGKQTEEEQQYSIKLRKYYEDLQGYQDTIDLAEQTIRNNQQYLKESAYINLNPEKVWVAEAQYLVKVDDEVLESLSPGNTKDPADAAISVYGVQLLGGLNMAEMEALTGATTGQYLQELVTVGASRDTDVISVKVRSDSEEKANKILTYFQDRLINVCLPLARHGVEHELIPIFEVVEAERVDAITEKRNKLNDATIKAQETIATTQASLNGLLREGEPETPGAHVKKMASIGFVVGAVLMAGVYLVLYLLGGVLRDSGDLGARFGVPILGELYSSRAKHPGKGLDGLIEKWEYKGKNRNESEIYDCAAALLGNKVTEGKILVTGTLPEEKIRKTAEALAIRLPKDIEVVCMGGFQDSSEAIQKALETKGILWVEEKGISRLHSLERMAEILSIGNVPVVGAVVL